MNYAEALNYIHSVSNYFCKPGLDRITELCGKLGNPQNNLKFIHVAGTNGKGSFSAMLASVLKEAGYKTGLYTSPYILEFNERISVNGEMISNDSLCELTERVKAYAEEMEDKPTEFELITAIAFEYFKSENCDVVVLECGLGGKLDATNVINDSVLSVITGISIDHTAFLGSTVEEIAGEKAGIIKEGGLCLWCGNNAEAETVIKNEAEKKNAKLNLIDLSGLFVKKWKLVGTVFDYNELENLELPLLGSFQPRNAVNVISAVNLLRNKGFNISDGAIYSGLAKTVWRARFEVINIKPLIIADGGHNPEGVSAAVDSIKLYFGDQKVRIITGVMKDKDYNYIAEKIATVADEVCCITPDNPRALGAHEYALVFEKLGVKSNSYDSVENALKYAIEFSTCDFTPIVCLGSLYMYKEITSALSVIL